MLELNAAFVTVSDSMELWLTIYELIKHGIHELSFF